MLDTSSKLDLLKAASSYAGFAEVMFRDPADLSAPLSLEPAQLKTINYLQFGYDIHNFMNMPTYPDGRKYHPHVILNKWGRQMGKSTVAAALAPAIIFSNPPPIRVALYGPHDESSKLLLTRTLSFIENSPGELMRFVDKKHLSSYVIPFLNGSEIRAFNSSPKLIRGWTNDFIIIDEIDQFENPTTIEEAILPTGVDRYRFGRGTALAISTPERKNKNSIFRQWVARAINESAVACKKCGTSYYKEQFFTDEITKHMLSPYKPIPPNFPKCPNCGAWDWDFVYKHFHVVPIDPYSSPRRPRAMIEDLRSRMSELAFRQEILGEFVTDTAGVFSRDQLESLCDSHLINNFHNVPRSPGTYRTMGVDFGRLADNTVFVVVDQEQQSKKCKIVSIEVMVANATLTWESIKNNVMRYIREFKPDSIIADTNSMGDAVVEDIAKRLLGEAGIYTQVYHNKPNRPGFVSDRTSKRYLIENLELYVLQGQIAFPPTTEKEVEALFDEMVDFGYETTDAGNIVYGGMSGHDDRVIALALALWGQKEKRYPRVNIKCI